MPRVQSGCSLPLFYIFNFEINLHLKIFSNLPPSQGGKYSGFGYSRDPPSKTQSQEIIDSTLSSLASVMITLYKNVSSH